MIDSVFSPEYEQVILNSTNLKLKQVIVNGETKIIESPYPSPDDWRDQIIYQIMIDRFNGPQTNPNEKWNQDNAYFMGGTFDGITKKLDYLKDLGIGAIWLTPVFKNRQVDNSSYHGYAIEDFLEIEPRFGTKRNDSAVAKQELHELIDQAHARGIYIIFDTVINHAGDVFSYSLTDNYTPTDAQEHEIFWRDDTGKPRSDWELAPVNCSPDAAVHPKELRRNDCFHRVGDCNNEEISDFYSLKDLKTELVDKSTAGEPDYYPVRDTLIKTCQYWIAEMDIDGIRLDAFKHIEYEFGRNFCNAVREYAQSIGKKDFMMFAEVLDNERKISEYIGTPCLDPQNIIGVDSAINFPLTGALNSVLKGFSEPTQLVYTIEAEKKAFRERYTTHGEATRYLYNMLDTHDSVSRFYYKEPSNPNMYNDQLTMGIACLYAMMGIPIIFYGTEQGLSGTDYNQNGQAYTAGMQRNDLCVREFLAGKPGAFDQNHPFYQQIKEMALLRKIEPALRYGRQYSREISDNAGVEFGISNYKNGVFAFSRILDNQEVLIALNTSTDTTNDLHIVVDYTLNNKDLTWKILYSNKGTNAVPPGHSQSPKVVMRPKGSVKINTIDGNQTDGPVCTIAVTLQPMECQILKGFAF